MPRKSRFGFKIPDIPLLPSILIVLVVVVVVLIFKGNTGSGSKSETYTQFGIYQPGINKLYTGKYKIYLTSDIPDGIHTGWRIPATIPLIQAGDPNSTPKGATWVYNDAGNSQYGTTNTKFYDTYFIVDITNNQGLVATTDKIPANDPNGKNIAIVQVDAFLTKIK